MSNILDTHISFAIMETNPDWPIYHGMIKADLAEARLRTDNRVGSYLVRYTGGDYVLSYIREGLSVKHVKLSYNKDTNLRKCHPGINDIRKTVSFLTGLKMHFLYAVSCEDFGEPEENSSIRRARLTCHICDKPFKDQAELLLHLRTHRISYCEVCDDIVPASSFQSHKLKCRAPDLTRPILKCDLCNVFETRHISSLKRHKELLHGEHSVMCHVCDKHFKNHVALQKHMSSHTGYPCHTCGKRYKTKAHLNRHIAKVHEQADESQESVINNSASPDSLSTVDGPSSASSPIPSTVPSTLTSTPSHSSAPRPDFPQDDDSAGSCDLEDGIDPPHDEHPQDQCSSDYEDLLEPGEHDSNINLGLYKCKFCKYKGNSKKRLRRHTKRCHPDGPPPLIECEFCPEFKTRHPKSLARHMENSCPGLKDFCVLDGDTLWDVLTEINISNNQAYKMLSLLKKKLGIR